MKAIAVLILSLTIVLGFCACTQVGNETTGNHLIENNPHFSDPACIHNYTEEITAQPNCVHDGEKKLTCTQCGDIRSETIAMLGHDYPAADCENNYWCSRCGDLQSALGHDFANGACTRCGLRYSPVEDSTWTASVGYAGGFCYWDVIFDNGTFTYIECQGYNINDLDPEEQESLRQRYPGQIDEWGNFVERTTTLTGTYTVEGDIITLVFQDEKATTILLRRDSESTINDINNAGYDLFGHVLRLEKAT